MCVSFHMCWNDLSSLDNFMILPYAFAIVNSV
jgi:hypothetical protein